MHRDKYRAVTFEQGEKIDRMTILGLSRKTKSGRYWKCQCECGGVKEITSSNLIRRAGTKSCDECSYGPSWNSKWVGEISGEFWAHIKGAAKSRNRQVLVSPNQAWELFLKQNRKCALTGIEIKFSKNWKNKDCTASLDRIDSSKDYTIDNIQWVHKDINRIKSNFPEDVFIRWCNLVSEYKNATKKM